MSEYIIMPFICWNFKDFHDLNDCAKENEMLKKQLECSREEADDLCEELMGKDEFIRLYKRQRDDALKENEQLKKENKELRSDRNYWKTLAQSLAKNNGKR